MRHATCIADLKLQLLGNRASVAITAGWQGDLDQVLGVQEIPAQRDAEGLETAPARSVPMTVADALGHHLTAANFEFVETEE